MPWDRKAPTDPKYRSKQHRDERARWARQLKRDGYLTCHQPTCVMPTRHIQPDQPWHLGHDDTGTTYIGPTHARCNVLDGARRGNARSHGTDTPRRWPAPD